MYIARGRARGPAAEALVTTELNPQTKAKPCAMEFARFLHWFTHTAPTQIQLVIAAFPNRSNTGPPQPHSASTLLPQHRVCEGPTQGSETRLRAAVH